ncbi:mucin-2 isoform X2 [Ictalurus furcatus]|nr:mucin-2 isoform X2 [Ictalurus furcatus]
MRLLLFSLLFTFTTGLNPSEEDPAPSPVQYTGTSVDFASPSRDGATGVTRRADVLRFRSTHALQTASVHQGGEYDKTGLSVVPQESTHNGQEKAGAVTSDLAYTAPPSLTDSKLSFTKKERGSSLSSAESRWPGLSVNTAEDMRPENVPRAPTVSRTHFTTPLNEASFTGTSLETSESHVTDGRDASVTSSSYAADEGSEMSGTNGVSRPDRTNQNNPVTDESNFRSESVSEFRSVARRSSSATADTDASETETGRTNRLPPSTRINQNASDHTLSPLFADSSGVTDAPGASLSRQIDTSTLSDTSNHQDASATTTTTRDEKMPERYSYTPNTDSTPTESDATPASHTVHREHATDPRTNGTDAQRTPSEKLRTQSGSPSGSVTSSGPDFGSYPADALARDDPVDSTTGFLLSVLTSQGNDPTTTELEDPITTPCNTTDGDADTETNTMTSDSNNPSHVTTRSTRPTPVTHHTSSTSRDDPATATPPNPTPPNPTPPSHTLDAVTPPSHTLDTVTPPSHTLDAVTPPSHTLDTVTPPSHTLDTVTPPSHTLDTATPPSHTLDTVTPPSHTLHAVTPPSHTLDTVTPPSHTLDTVTPPSHTLDTVTPPSHTLDTVTPPSHTLDTVTPPSHTLDTVTPPSHTLDTVTPPSHTLDTVTPPSHTLDTVTPPSHTLDTVTPPSHTLDTATPPSHTLDTATPPSHTLDTATPPSHTLDTVTPPSHTLDTVTPPSHTLDTVTPPSHTLDTVTPPSHTLDTVTPPSHTLDTVTPPSHTLDTATPPSHTLDTATPPSHTLDTATPPSHTLNTATPPSHTLDTATPPSHTLDTATPPSHTLDTVPTSTPSANPMSRSLTTSRIPNRLPTSGNTPIVQQPKTTTTTTQQVHTDTRSQPGTYTPLTPVITPTTPRRTLAPKNHKDWSYKGRVFITEDQPAITNEETFEVLLQVILEENSPPDAGLVEVEPFLQNVAGYRSQHVTWHSGPVLQSVVMFRTAEAVSWLGRAESLLQEAGLRPLPAGGVFVSGVRVKNITVGGPPSDTCSWLFSCPSDFYCVSLEGNVTCRSMCHSEYCKNHGICVHHAAQPPVCQ